MNLLQRVQSHFYPFYKQFTVMLYLLVLIDPFFCSYEGLTLETSALETLQWSIYIINSVNETR